TTKAGIEKLLKAVGLDQIVISERAKTPPGQRTTPETQQPAKVVKLADTIQRLVARVERKLTLGRIGPVGVLLLIWAVLTLLTTMERSLNRIFGARRVRSLGRRVLLYWSVVTLGPLLLVTAGYLGAAATQVLQDIPVVSWVLATVGWVGPIVVEIAFLAAVYKLMPNTHVKFNAAVGGAAVAIPLWLIAKWAFGLYVYNLVGKGSLYGTLGLLPLFLLWLNLSWLLFLFGATLAHTAANLAEMQADEESERFVLTPSVLLAATAAVAGPYLAGSGPVPLEQVAARLRLTSAAAERLLDPLIEMHILSRVDAEDARAYLLARPAEKIPIPELMAVDEPKGAAGVRRRYPTEIAETVARFESHTRDALTGLTLADLLPHNR
ncbi:MAG: hypothetical protein AMS16_04470, partial [Planctomycetes bacterium DG_58]